MKLSARQLKLIRSAAASCRILWAHVLALAAVRGRGREWRTFRRSCGVSCDHEASSEHGGVKMSQQYCDRAGNVVDATVALDAAGHLRNGFGMRVPLQLCDSMQKDVAEFYDGKRRTRTQCDSPWPMLAPPSHSSPRWPVNPRPSAASVLPSRAMTLTRICVPIVKSFTGQGGMRCSVR